MKEETIHVVIIAPRPEKDQKVTNQNEQRVSKSRDDFYQSSVDDDNFLQKNKKRLAESQVVNKIQNAKKESPNKLGFILRLFITFATSTCFTFLLTMLMFIPLSKVIIGSIFFDACPAEPFIPIYLVVGGTVACVRDVLNMCLRSWLSDQAYYDYDIPITLVAFSYSLAEFGWFVYGSVYVYALFHNFQWKDKTASDYCSSLLYMFAFVLTTMSYFLLFITCCISGVTICIAQCLGDGLGEDQKPTTVVIIHQHEQQQQQEQHEQQQQQQEQQQRGSVLPEAPNNKQE